MKTHIPDTCGNSPRSLLAIEIAVNLAANEHDKIAQFLAEDFSWSVAGSGEVLLKPELNNFMEKANQSKAFIDRIDILTSISHGKYAAVSSRVHMLNGHVFNSHDLYEFTGAGRSAKLLKVTSYTVDSKH